MLPLHGAAAGLLAAALGLTSTVPSVERDAPGVPDPAGWGDRRLAAQLVVSCVDMADLDPARRHAAAGLGGVVLLGRPPADLRRELRQVRADARGGVAPFVASDEEGGQVQRLADLIRPLPSARRMGTWSPRRIRATARSYGTAMHRLGVGMALSPVADLADPGSYLDRLGRAFAADPATVARAARAWRLGLRDAGVVAVVKHWPGHGSARNTHTVRARVAPLSLLERRDLRPFDAELADGAPAVMVGHLLSRGLTRGGVPTSLSPRAMRYLRRSAGPDTVVVTDSLSMAAASTVLGLSPARATVRALRAGADLAMPCDAAPLRAVAAVRRALADGELPRRQAVRSARRVLALKAAAGLVTEEHR